MPKFDTKTMLPAIDIMPKTESFLRDTFFPRTKDESLVTEKVELDYKKGQRRMAPFVAPRVGGITQTRDGFKTFEIAPPRIAPQIPMTIDDISGRSMGENVYSRKTPAQRAQELLAKDLVSLGAQIDRREEWMAAQLLFEGKVVVQGYADNDFKNPIEQEIDYGFDKREVLSGTELFIHADSNPIAYMREKRLKIIEDGGEAPNIVVFGMDAYQAFISNPKVVEYFNHRHMLFGQIAPSIQSKTVTFVGKLNEIGVEIYVYNDMYLDEEGELHPFVPKNKMLMAHTDLGRFLYGAVTQLEPSGRYVTYEGTRIPKFWSDVANDIKMMRLTSRPVPLPENIDSWCVATVV